MTGRQGFTLIEVVVALAILGTGLVVLLEANFASLSLFADAKDTATLQMLTQQAVGWAEVAIFEGEDTGDGDFGTGYPEFHYQYQADRVNEEEMPGLFRVSVTVSGPGELSQRMEFLTYDSTQEQREADTKSPGTSTAKPPGKSDAK